MPNFTFKCEFGHMTETFLPGLVPERSVCKTPGCTAAARPAFAPHTLPQYKKRYRDRRPDQPEYREDLARFKGDRRAIVTGDRDLKKLIDVTRREVEDQGGIVRPLSEAAADVGDPIEQAGEEDLLAESYQDALQELNDEEA